MRSMLFAGATRPDLVAKLDRSGSDAVVIDLEDAVPEEAKRNARAALPDLVATVFGPRDFIRVNAPRASWFEDEPGGRRSAGGEEVLYARSRVVLAARLAGVPAIDQVVVDFRDEDAFRRDADAQHGADGTICQAGDDKSSRRPPDGGAGGGELQTRAGEMAALALETLEDA